MNPMDELIREDFNRKVDRAFIRWKASPWFGSTYAGAAAVMAFLADEIPEKYEWEPVVTGSSLIPIPTLIGYTPDMEEVLQASPKLNRSVN